MDFSGLSAKLESLGLEQAPAEIHGLATGYVCGGGWEDRVPVLLDWLDQDPGDEGREFLDHLFEETRRQLADPDFGFRPLLPEDDENLSARGRAISGWCAAFISGFGSAGKFKESDLDQEVKEVLSDLHKISAMTDQIPDNDENEADFTEIAEYVRVSALLVFASCAVQADQGE